MRPRLSTILRLGVAVALTLFILERAPLGQIGAALSRVSWPPVLAACALVFVDRALMAYRSVALLDHVRERRPPLTAMLRIFFVSTFIGNTVGTDVARVWSLSREGVPGSESLASVLMDRLLGVVSILISAVVGLALVPSLLADRNIEWAFTVIAIGCAAAMAFVFSTTVDDALRRLIERWPAGRVRGTVTRVLDALQAYRSERRMLVVVLVASMAVQVLRILQAWLLGVSLGILAPLSAYFALVPIILLVMLLPVTVNGIGTSQVAFAWCFAQIVPPVAYPEAIALSILFVALGLAGNLPGALWYVAGSRHRQASDR